MTIKDFKGVFTRSQMENIHDNLRVYLVNFGYLKMVKADFEALKSGEKRLEDLSEHFWNGEKDAYILGMNI